MQLDQRNRGFAYSVDAPLDMRMNPDDPITAADVLNTYDHGDLARVLADYGEERFAGRIASAVVAARRTQPFTTSGPLVDLLYATIPAATRRTGGHRRSAPSGAADRGQRRAGLSARSPAGRTRRDRGGWARRRHELPVARGPHRQTRVRAAVPPRVHRAGLPVELPGTAPRFTLVTRGAEQATDDEIEANLRSAPARVRAIERIADGAEGE